MKEQDKSSIRKLSEEEISNLPNKEFKIMIISSVQLLSSVWFFETLWTTARQASLSITNFQSLRKLMSIESMMPSNHLTLCHPLLLLPSIFPSIRVFSNESALLIRWPNYWTSSFFINLSNEHPELISFRMDLLDLLCVLIYLLVLIDSTYLFLMMTLIRRYDCDHHLKMWKSMCWKVNERAP